MSKLLDRERLLDTQRRSGTVPPAPAAAGPSAPQDPAPTAPDPAILVMAAPPAPLAEPLTRAASPSTRPARRGTRFVIRVTKLALAGLAAFWLSRPFIEPLMPLELPPPDAPVPVAAVPAPESAPTVVTIEVVDAAPAVEDPMPEQEEFQPASLEASDGASPDTAAMPAEPAPPAPDAGAPAAPEEPLQGAHPAPVVLDVMDMAMERANAVYDSMETALRDAADLSRSREAKQPRRWWTFGGS